MEIFRDESHMLASYLQKVQQREVEIDR